MNFASSRPSHGDPREMINLSDKEAKVMLMKPLKIYGAKKKICNVSDL